MALSLEERRELIIRFNNENFNLGTSYRLLFREWLNSGDPDYLDKLIIDMNKKNIEIKGVILEQVAISAMNRLLRKYKYTKKTIINQDVLLDETCWIVCKLTHFCNLTMEKATLLAAGLLDAKFPLESKKASTIDKQYSDWKKTHKESISIMKSYKPNGWTQEEQSQYLALFPEKISSRLSGNRRN